MSKDKKDAHNPVPVPDKETPKLDKASGDEYGVFGAVRSKEPPAAGPVAPHAAEPPPPESLVKAKEDKTPVFKVQVRNSFVSVDASIRAGSAEEAEKQFKEWLCAGLVVKEG